MVHLHVTSASAFSLIFAVLFLEIKTLNMNTFACCISIAKWVWVWCEGKSLNGLLSIDFNLLMLMTGPLPGLCSFHPTFTERQVLWSLSSVDFHTLTLQLPIQTQNYVAPELHVFVSSLKISAKRAHPCCTLL